MDGRGGLRGGVWLDYKSALDGGGGRPQGYHTWEVQSVRIDVAEGEDGLDGGFCGVAAYVLVGAGAGEGLFFVFAGEDAEVAGDAGVESDLLDASSGLSSDVQVMVGLMANDGTEADDGVVVVGVCGVEGGNGKLEGPRDPKDVVRGDAMTFDGLLCAGKEAGDDVFVEARDDDGEGDV